MDHVTELLEKMGAGEWHSKRELEIIATPQRVVESRVPIKTQSGVVYARGFRVQHSDARGPFKGGIRFHPSVDLEHVKTLAFLMSVKCAVAGIPMGGGKGGLAIDPKTMDETALECASRSFVRQFANLIGPEVDVPAPDVNTDSRVMAWMLDEYEKIKGVKNPAAFTGKPLELGGSKGRAYSTSLGGLIALTKSLSNNKPQETRIAVQGFGNVGSNFARLAYRAGFRIVAVSDVDGAAFDPNGLDIEAILAQYKEKRFAGIGKSIERDEVITTNCDVLVPAAMEHTITKDNAMAIKAKTILELANDPTTPAADAILTKRGVTIIPDVLANSGGVVVSYFEWLQNKQGVAWSEEKVNEELEKTMAKAYADVSNAASAHGITLRRAAFKIGLERILEAERKRAAQ